MKLDDVNKYEININKSKGVIYNCDCIKGVQALEEGSFDIVITSPPYNNSRQRGSLSNHERRYVDFEDNMSNEDYIDWTVKLFNALDEKMSKDGVILYNMSYGGENPTVMWLTIADIIRRTNFTVADCLVWKKKSALPNNVSPNKMTRITEFIFVISRKSEYKTFRCNKKVKSVSKTGQKFYYNEFNFFEAKNNDGSNPLNKATFSTDMVINLLNRYAKKGDTILDTFNGTGTTSNACIEKGLNFIGFEISKEQCEYAVARLNKNVIRKKPLRKVPKRV
jgi:DNA modification methylase